MQAGPFFIDERELTENFVRASGPGGQNVNKVSTAVELRFDARRSPSLPADVAMKLIRLAGQRATQDGVIVIFAQTYASQPRNREDGARPSRRVDRARCASRQAAPADAPDARLEETPARREEPSRRRQGAARQHGRGLMETFTVPRPDGHDVLTRVWLPPAPAKAVVQIVHGLAEHSARYDRLAQALTGAGYAVYAHDHRGHGPSATELGYFAGENGWRKLLDDIDAVARRIAADLPATPRVFLGHSMGSFLGQTYIAGHGGELAAAVLSGDGGTAAGGSGRWASWSSRSNAGGSARTAHSRLVQTLLFGAQNKPFQPARTDFDWLSRDAAEVDKYVADPFCGFPLSTGLVSDLVGALSAVWPRQNSPRGLRRRCRSICSAARAIRSAPSYRASWRSTAPPGST